MSMEAAFLRKTAESLSERRIQRSGESDVFPRYLLPPRSVDFLLLFKDSDNIFMDAVLFVVTLVSMRL